MLSEIFILALKNLKTRGLRSWLTMLGIFIGIAAVVSLISLSQGLETAITAQFGSIDPDKLTVQNAGTGFGPPGSTSIKKLTSHDVDVIRSVSGVDLVISRLIRMVKVEYNDVSKFKYASSITENPDENKVIYDSINAEILSGRLLEINDHGKVLLGYDFVNEADDFGKPIRAGLTIRIQGKNFEVAGLLDDAGTFTINSLVLMTEPDIKDLLNIGDETDLIIVQVKDVNQIEKVAGAIERSLRKDRKLDLGEEDFSVQTPLQGLEAIKTILNIISLIVTGIAAISLLVGGIGIANTMFTSVLERTKEIGIMKSIGAKNSDILLIFLIESALLGLAGGIIGAIIGLGLAFGAASAASSVLGGIDLPIIISYPLVFAAIAFSLVVGVLSGIIPAYQASRLNPVEALRK